MHQQISMQEKESRGVRDAVAMVALARLCVLAPLRLDGKGTLGAIELLSAAIAMCIANGLLTLPWLGAGVGVAGLDHTRAGIAVTLLAVLMALTVLVLEATVAVVIANRVLAVAALGAGVGVAGGLDHAVPSLALALLAGILAWCAVVFVVCGTVGVCITLRLLTHKALRTCQRDSTCDRCRSHSCLTP